MSENENKKALRLSDQVIGQVRELLQLCILTQTHIVDNLRTLELEEHPEHPGLLVLSEGYCEGWNKMVADLEQKAQEKHEEMQKLAQDVGEEAVATETPEVAEESFIKKLN